LEAAQAAKENAPTELGKTEKNWKKFTLEDLGNKKKPRAGLEKPEPPTACTNGTSLAGEKKT